MSARDALDICRWIQRQRKRHGLSGTTQAVAHAIAHRIDADYKAWPSLATIAEDAGVSLRTVKRSLTALEAVGILTRERRRRPDGSHASTVYRFTGEGIPGQTTLPLDGQRLGQPGPGTGAGCTLPSERDQPNGFLSRKREGACGEVRDHGTPPATVDPEPATVDPEAVERLPGRLRDIVHRRGIQTREHDRDASREPHAWARWGGGADRTLTCLPRSTPARGAGR